MTESWSPRKLLICRYLLLNQPEVSKGISPWNLIFNYAYPDPTILWDEPSQVLACLIDLQKARYIKLSDIKISREYLNVYHDKQYPELAKIASRASYGLPKDTLAKVENGESLDIIELLRVVDFRGKSSKGLGTLWKHLFASQTPKLTEQEFRDDYIKYHLAFPVVIAKHVSFSIEVDEKKLTSNFNSYLVAFKSGQTRDRNSGRRFSFDFKKELVLAALAKIAKKQGLSEVVWQVGYLDPRFKTDATEADDELLALMKSSYPDAYHAWNSGNVKGGQQYPLEFYETLFALEQDGIVLVASIKSDSAAAIDRPISHKLHEGWQVLTFLTLVIAKPEFLSDGNSVNNKAATTDAGPKFPHKLPAGTRWGQILIAFKDDKNVTINAKNFKPVEQDYVQMGFLDKRTEKTSREPDRLWKFFVILAQSGGEIELKGEIEPKDMETLKSTKMNFSDRLSRYFRMESDPFYPYEPELPDKPKSSYKTRFLVSYPAQVKDRSENLLDRDESILIGDDRFADLQDFINEQSPQIDDSSRANFHQ